MRIKDLAQLMGKSVGEVEGMLKENDVIELKLIDNDDI